MTIRETLERNEERYLSPAARLARSSAGRVRPEEPDATRTCFMQDRDRIIHCKAFRRLKHKTQVFLSPEGDHSRTRLTHTLEVGQISRTVAKGLMLNEDLVEAMAMGHDLGHTPFGHAGERALNEISPKGFAHNHQSLRVVDYLEKDGEGLNLTREVREGILCHTGDIKPSTLEGQILRYADRIAYINHDIDDAIRAGVLNRLDIPAALRHTIGDSHGQRINTLVTGMIAYGLRTGQIGLEPELEDAMKQLREFMFNSVYYNPRAKGEEVKVVDIIMRLYEYYIRDLDRLPRQFREIAADMDPDTAVCDYIAGMTDNYAVECFKDAFIPKSWTLK